mgnify:CR=1
MFFKRHLSTYRARDLFNDVKSQVNPDVSDLKRLVDFHKVPIGTLEEQHALRLKYQAMTHSPTIIEKTMTPAQLYEADCPLWAIAYSIEQLSYYFMLDSWPYTGAGIIEFMNGNGWKLSHHMIIADEPRRKGTVQVPPCGPFA